MYIPNASQCAILNTKNDNSYPHVEVDVSSNDLRFGENRINSINSDKQVKYERPAQNSGSSVIASDFENCSKAPKIAQNSLILNTNTVF